MDWTPRMAWALLFVAARRARRERLAAALAAQQSPEVLRRALKKLED